MNKFFLAAKKNQAKANRTRERSERQSLPRIIMILLPPSLILFTLIYSELGRSFLLVGEACSACLERQKV